MEYDVIEMQGENENSLIRLHIPKAEATEEEVNELHKTVAEIILNINKDSKKAACV